MAAFPEKARVVIIGLGGIVGASIAHHLIERGWDDIVGIDKSGIPTDIGSTAHASDFCYTTSHDYLSVWTTQYSIDFYEKMGHYARIGGLEVARTGELLNELEDRLIYENDAFDLNITQVNVSDLAHRVAIGHEGGFAQKKLDFIYNIEPDVIIEADSVRLAQVLINLLSNSIKYTQAGGASLSLKREGRNVVIEITDSGEGMDEETAKNIINRSSQAFKAVNSKGVGLYIAKLIVDKHGWALDIESHKGRGTTVRIIM